MRPLFDVSDADWIGPGLGQFGSFAGTVPSGYAAYARVCHPAEDADGRLVPWPAVAAVTGRRAHPNMQWHALIGSANPVNPRSDLWPEPCANPDRGNLEPESLSTLCGVLASHTGTPDDCRFALWEGWGIIHGYPLRQRLGRSLRFVEPRISREQFAGPRVRLPGRDYLLFQGTLADVDELPWNLGERDAFLCQSPNMFWPVDRAWFVATEIDYDSTVVAGTRSLVDALLATAGLDAWDLGPDISHAATEDVVNPVPGVQ